MSQEKYIGMDVHQATISVAVMDPGFRHKLPCMEHPTIEPQIRAEIYRAFELLGADRELLETIGSWGDTLDDKEITCSSNRSPRRLAKHRDCTH